MTDDLMERIEGCIANAEHEDEHETLIDARDRIEAQAAEIEKLREALRDVLVYCPDYMHGLPKKDYEAIWRKAHDKKAGFEFIHIADLK